MKPYARAARVGTQVQRVMSDLLRKKIKDPRVESVTITGVTMSRDLRHARVYFVASGDVAHREAAEAGLADARGYLKRFLASELKLRYMPEIKFFYDTSLDYGTRIEKLLTEIRAENETDPGSTDS